MGLADWYISVVFFAGEHEVGTENKILLLGCEDGTVHCLAVRSRQNLFSVPHCSAVNCVAILSVDYFVVGCQDGQILLYSFQHPSEPLHCWFESNSAGLCLLPFKEDGFFIGKADGTCIYHHLPTRNSNEKLRNIRVQLTGPDCDPVYDLSFDGTYVYTASRDATVRKYDVLKVLPHLESFVWGTRSIWEEDISMNSSLLRLIYFGSFGLFIHSAIIYYIFLCVL